MFLGFFTGRRGGGLGLSRDGSRGGHVAAFLGLLGPSSECVDLVGALLLDEVGQVFDSPRPGVLNWRVLRASGEEFDGREALDRVGNVIRGSVDLGHRHLGGKLRVGVELGELLVLRSEPRFRQ